MPLTAPITSIRRAFTSLFSIWGNSSNRGDAKVAMFFLLLIAVMWASAGTALAQTPALTVQPAINTVAGNGDAYYGGDNGPATSAYINYPTGIAVDSAGNLYIADNQNNRVRKVNAATGIITTVAGTGTGGYNGDNIAATSAELYYPNAVALDSAGNLYIADSSNSRIRKVNASTGIITTVAGTGYGGWNGDNISAITAELYNPTSVAVDSVGNIYIADDYNNRVRKVSAYTGIITTVAGTGGYGFSGDTGPAVNAKLYYPYSIALDSTGNLYICDLYNNRVRMVTASTGIINTVAGNGSYGYSGDGGPAISATMYNPMGITVDGAGNFYFADQVDGRIRMVNASTGIITTVAGNGTYGDDSNGLPATSSAIYAPFGVALDAAGNLYIADEDTSQVRKVNAATAPLSFLNTAVGATSAPQSLLLYVNAALTISSVTVPSSQGGQHEFTVGAVSGCATDGITSNSAGSICSVPITFTPAFPGQRQMPLVVQTSAGNFQFALEGTGTGPLVAFGPGIISTVAGNGTQGYSGDSGAATAAETNSPLGIAVDGAGNLFISDFTNQRIRKVTASTGIISTVAGTGTAGYNGDNIAATSAQLNGPFGVAVDGAGNLYIADPDNSRIRMVAASTGTITTVAGTGTAGYNGDNIAATSAQLNLPYGVTVDSAGNLYIADVYNERIRKVNASTGIITTVAGMGTAGYNGDNSAATSAELDYPFGVAVDSAGNLYIADFHNQRIRMVTASTGIITTVAGTGTSGYNGDNIAATSAELYGPSGVAVDSAGNLYIGDYGNNSIRKVTASTGIITTAAGTGTAGYNGDNIAATSAALNLPHAVAVDSTGNLYIPDTVNQRIRKVDVSDAPSLNFGSIAPNSTSAAQDVSVLNLGNASLNIASISTAANFSLGGADTTCSTGSQTLTPAASCVLGIEFAPTTAGIISGSVVLTDNTLNASSATQSISLQGVGTASPATMTTPTNGSTLTGAATTFTWSANGSSGPYYIWVGSTPGGLDLGNAGVASGSSMTLNLPTTGNTIYVTLWSSVNGNEVSNSYTYTEASLLPASMSSPTSGSTLSGAATTFTWSANGSTGPFYIWVGSTPGGLDLGNAGVASGSSMTLTLPTNSNTIYVTLWSTLNGGGVSKSYTYTEATMLPATMSTPANGSTLTGASTTFTWSANGSTGPYYIWVGSTPGGLDLGNAGVASGSSMTLTLPTNSNTIYVTLWSLVNGKEVSSSYQYIESH